MNLQGYRTIIWNIANAIIAAMNTAEMQFGVPEAWQPYWLAVFIAGNVILRYKTTTPIGKKA